jgi:peptidoglycan/xylan/chitin deacetylase (PgdA/CDA1 family)
MIQLLINILENIITALLMLSGMIIYYAGMARIVIAWRSLSLRVLMYHACEEVEGDFIRGLAINTTPARLAAQLDFLCKYYRVVALGALKPETLPKRAVVITFDDGFRSVYQNALPLLKARELPATCCLVTDVIENQSLIWINELNWFLHRHPGIARPLVVGRLRLRAKCSHTELIDRVVARYDQGTVRELLAELRARFGTDQEALAQSDRLYLKRSEIVEMSRQGFTFGNHTASHAVLTNLAADDCHEEIRRARAMLQTLPASTDSLAYPFGRFNEATRQIAIDLGYKTLMAVEGDNVPLVLTLVGRVNVTSESPAMLFARMEISAPLKFLLKRFANRLAARLQRRRA